MTCFVSSEMLLYTRLLAVCGNSSNNTHILSHRKFVTSEAAVITVLNLFYVEEVNLKMCSISLDTDNSCQAGNAFFSCEYKMLSH